MTQDAAGMKGYPMDENKTLNILTIDGGGFRGIYAAHIMARIENSTEIKWTQHFDLIAGTSTGAIIAAGIMCGLSAKEICSFYKEKGKLIFKKSMFRRFGLFASRYKNNELKSALKEIFKDKKLGEIKKALIIPSTDIVNGCVHVFKSAYDKSFVRDNDVYVSDAVLASCSAPMYFDPCNITNYTLVDGGLWANNPSLVAVIDAKRRLGMELNRLKILSIGTGTSKQFYSQKLSFFKKYFGWGFLTNWKRERFIMMLLNLQAETSNNMLKLLLEKQQIMRISFGSESALSLDDYRDDKDLISRADRDFSHNSEQIIQFINGIMNSQRGS